MVDMVVERHKLRDTVVRILDLLRNHAPSGDVVPFTPDSGDEEDGEDDAEKYAVVEPDAEDPAAGNPSRRGRPGVRRMPPAE